MAKFVEVPELDDDLKYASEQISKIAGDAINAIKELYLNRQNLPSGNGHQNSPIAVTAKREELGLRGLRGSPEMDCSHMGSSPASSNLTIAPLMVTPSPPSQPAIDSTPRKEWVDESLNGTLL